MAESSLPGQQSSDGKWGNYRTLSPCLLEAFWDVQSPDQAGTPVPLSPAPPTSLASHAFSSSRMCFQLNADVFRRVTNALVQLVSSWPNCQCSSCWDFCLHHIDCNSRPPLVACPPPPKFTSIKAGTVPEAQSVIPALVQGGNGCGIHLELHKRV